MHQKKTARWLHYEAIHNRTVDLQRRFQTGDCECSGSADRWGGQEAAAGTVGT